MSRTRSTAGERFEGVAQVLILLAIGGMAAAASFTHVHDWTMTNSPDGTGDWFGWANAVVSDLVPLGVGLEVRRRRRHNLRIGAYPILVILAAASLSIAGQLAMARPSVTGWLLAAVPALGFLALTKLVISRPTAPPAVAVRPATQPMPVQATLHPATAPGPEDLIPGARIVADAYHKATGHQIDATDLAERLRVPLHTAERLLDAIRPTESRIPVRLNTAEALA
jgi:hypothetical protein